MSRLLFLALFAVGLGCGAEPPPLPPMEVVPTAEQVAYQSMELAGFIHFSMNTFTDREWGYGDESPEWFDPSALDTDQWARVASEVGMGEVILTAKHHDGFTLWPSATTRHSVGASPWRDGKGDLVAEFVDAARRHGLLVGLYVSPWDRNHGDYGTPGYLEAYREQLRELLTGYGPVNEVWVDGANGGTGFYGGAREERRIDRRSYYRWPETMAHIKALQPKTLIFSDAGPDIRWIGNEQGFAGETNWSTIDVADIVIGEADTEYLNRGDPRGRRWVVPLCDVSIRPGWFYHSDQDEEVKSPQELVDLYYRSVGRNCVLLLNVPPDRRGRLHERDVEALREFRRILDETFARDLAPAAQIEADHVRGNHEEFSPSHLLDGDADSFWAADDEVRSAVLTLTFPEPAAFDRLLLQEPIRMGQRISAFSVQVRVGAGWQDLARGTTIGHKRLLRFPEVRTDGLRLRIENALAAPALSRIGLFRASPDEAGLGLPTRDEGL